MCKAKLMCRIAGKLLASTAVVAEKDNRLILVERVDPLLSRAQWKKLSALNLCNLMLIRLANIDQAELLATLKHGLHVIGRKVLI